MAQRGPDASKRSTPPSNGSGSVSIAARCSPLAQDDTIALQGSPAELRALAARVTAASERLVLAADLLVSRSWPQG